MTQAGGCNLEANIYKMDMDDMYMIGLMTLTKRQNDYDRRKNRERASVMGGSV